MKKLTDRDERNKERKRESETEGGSEREWENYIFITERDKKFS